MSLKRKAMRRLLDWKAHKTHQALLVTGARQVGKTFLVRQFARENYEHLVEFNLVEQPAVAKAFAGASDAATLFMRLSALATEPLEPGATLVFIDEVQECKEIVTSLKFLVERFGQDYDFVVSGSLLGVELQDIRSFPVGFLSVVELFPLDFEEFCWANGVSAPALDAAREAFTCRRILDDVVHVRLMGVFHDYLVVGGMPDAVQVFLDSRNVQQVQHVQNDILQLYRHDISKYAGERARTVRRIFDLVPSELNTQGKRFAIGHVEGASRYNRYENDFLWLIDAGVALAVCNVDEPRYPLGLAVDSSYFKLFLCDVGLLSCACGMEVVRGLIEERPDINYGSVYENFVAQELAAHGLCAPAPNRCLYFFRSRKLGELDFLAEWPRGRVLPIEVKSGKGYRRHSALTNALATENYGLQEAFVLSEGNVEKAGKITYLPVYMVMFLERDAGA